MTRSGSELQLLLGEYALVQSSHGDCQVTTWWLARLAEGKGVNSLSLFHPEGGYGHSAVLSPCRTWRYALERRWGSGPFVLFVGLNPSTADETEDDPTIRRCIGFAKDWGFGGLLMGNLFAFRSTDPKGLTTCADPVGPDNDVWLTTLSCRSGLTIAAWGAHPMAEERAADVLDALGDVSCLGMTKHGHPRHPLYLPKTSRPLAFHKSRSSEVA